MREDWDEDGFLAQVLYVVVAVVVGEFGIETGFGFGSGFEVAMVAAVAVQVGLGPAVSGEGLVKVGPEVVSKVGQSGFVAVTAVPVDRPF